MAGSSNCLIHMFLGCWGAFFHVVIQGTKTITACGSLFPRTSVSSASLSGNGHRAWRRHAYSLKAMANERYSHFYLHHVGKTGHMAPGTVKGAFWWDNCFPNTISYRRKADFVDSKLPLPQCKNQTIYCATQTYSFFLVSILSKWYLSHPGALAKPLGIILTFSLCRSNLSWNPADHTVVTYLEFEHLSLFLLSNSHSEPILIHYY